MLQVVSPLKKAFEAEVRIMNYLGIHPSPASFRLGGHGEHLERGEARLGQREYRSGRTGNGTADLPPAAAPRSQAIQL